MPIEQKLLHYQYIHEVFGCFVETLSNYLSKKLYNDSKEVVIGTYEKSLEYYKKKSSEGSFKHTNKYPLISINPRLDVEPTDIVGKLFYQYPHMGHNYQAIKEYRPFFYEDDNVTIAPVLNRYRGSMEIIIWCRSVYEAIDLKVLTYQFWGGVNRQIYPINIEGYFIMPNEFLYYEHNNPYEQNVYKIDWPNYIEEGKSNPKAENILIKTINKDKWVYPFSLRPWLTLQSVSDASVMYGGDDLSDYKLMIEVEWECALPTHCVLWSYLFPSLSPSQFFELNVGIHHRDYYGNEIPSEAIYIVGDTDDKGNESVKSIDVSYLEKWEYILDEDVVNSLDKKQDVFIDLDRVLEDNEYIKIYYKDEILRQGYTYAINSSRDQLLLKYLDLQDKFEVDDLLTIIVMKEDSSQ